MQNQNNQSFAYGYWDCLLQRRNVECLQLFQTEGHIILQERLFANASSDQESIFTNRGKRIPSGSISCNAGKNLSPRTLKPELSM